MTHTHTDTDLITLAADTIGATSYAGATVYAWRDDASGEVCLASPEQLADLGMRLAAGEADAYSLWCSELSLESATPAEVAASFPDLAGAEVDLDALCAEAASAGDLLTVAVIDLAGDALARAFEAEEADGDSPICIFLPVAAGGRADSSLPILPTHVYVSADGSAVAAYDGAEDVAYAAVGDLLAEHRASFVELVGDELDLECQPAWISEAIVEAALAYDEDAIEEVAEARYLELLGEAFPLESLCDLDADPPAGDDTLRASIGGHHSEWFVFCTSGHVWHPGDIALAALLRAEVIGGYDLDAAAVALCDQAPSLGVWHM